MLRLSDCQTPLHGDLRGEDIELNGFSIDTRTLEAGDLYIAIKGERYDGHDYCAQAEENGAVGLLVQHAIDSDLPQLIVSDTRLALQQLSSLWAQLFQVPTVAVTGSNGKTTVKEMIAAILGQLGPVLATKGNFNNDIGVPLTLLRLRSHHQYAVIEIGANHAGEVGALSRLVRPDVALVNNVGPAHLEGFGSIEAVADAKSEIYEGLQSDGWAVVNADDKFAPVMREAAAHCHVYEFGTDENAAVQVLSGDTLKLAAAGKTLSPRFALLGSHNKLNAAAATAAAQCMDVQPVAIMSGLASVVPVGGRLDTKPGVRGATLIDDTYNANPSSVKAAINVLAECKGTRCLVLGDLGELGADEESLHRELGEYAAKAGIDKMLTVGVLSAAAANAFDGAVHFDSQDNLITHLHDAIDRNWTVLIKGSRGSRMEDVVNPLVANVVKDADYSNVDASDCTEAISL